MSTAFDVPENRNKRAKQYQYAKGYAKTIIFDEPEQPNEIQPEQPNEIQPEQPESIKDLYQDNEKLIEETEKMVAIFEQYMKVALLQMKAKQKSVDSVESLEKKPLEKKPDAFNNYKLSVASMQHVGSAIYVSENPSRFGRTSQINRHDSSESGDSINEKLLQMKDRKHSQKLIKKSFTGQSSEARILESIRKKKGSLTGQVSLARLENSKQKDSVSKLSLKKRPKPIQSNPQFNSPARDSRSVISPVIQGEPTFLSLMSVTQDLNYNHQRFKSPERAISRQKSRKSASKSPTKERELTVVDSTMAQCKHNAQLQWIKRIDKVWKRLEEDHHHQEVVRMENEIKNNRKIRKQLEDDNLKLAINLCKSEVKLISQQKQKSKQVATGKKTFRKVKLIEEKIKKEIDRSQEVNSWGLSDAIISLKLKCRTLESVIDCAVRLEFKGTDKNMVKELAYLMKLRDQTWQDINTFIQLRDQHEWRVWYVNPEMSPGKPVFTEIQSIRELDEFNSYLDQMNFDVGLWTKIYREMEPYARETLAKFAQQAGKKVSRKLITQATLVYAEMDAEKIEQAKFHMERIEAARMERIEAVKMERIEAAKIAQESGLPSINEEYLDYGRVGFGDSDMFNSPLIASLLNTSSSMFKNKPRKIDEKLMQNRELTWVETLAIERKNFATTAEKVKQERAARLARLFSSDYGDSDEDMDKALDQKAAQNNINRMNDKIETHLQVEKNLLYAWMANDFKEKQADAEKSTLRMSVPRNQDNLQTSLRNYGELKELVYEPNEPVQDDDEQYFGAMFGSTKQKSPFKQTIKVEDATPTTYDKKAANIEAARRAATIAPEVTQVVPPPLGKKYKSVTVAPKEEKTEQLEAKLQRSQGNAIKVMNSETNEDFEFAIDRKIRKLKQRSFKRKASTLSTKSGVKSGQK